MLPTTPARRRRRRWPWLLLLVVLVGSAAAVALAAKGPGKNGTVIAPDDLEVRTGKSEVADVEVTVAEVGTIEPSVKVDVKSALSGKVTELLVRAGDRVARGQVLARVEPDVNQAQTFSAVRSDLRMAEIHVADARRDLETNTRLHGEGYVSDRALFDFQVKLDTALESLEAARAKNRIVEESGIPPGGTIATTQRANIVAPMDGVVIARNVEVGQTVTSGVSSFNEGTVLFTVADLGSMLIKASVNEVDIGRIRAGMRATITVDAFPYQHYEGTVTHISPAARLAERVKVFDIEVELARQVPEFRAGMTANIGIRGDRAEQVLSVPVEAIIKRDEREVVYVLKTTFAPQAPGEKSPRKLRSGKLDVSETWQRFFEERPVEVGLSSLERAQVLAGLDAGVQVALEDPTRPRQIQED